MAKVDPYLERATAPGTPFEIGERDGMKLFVNAPDDLNMMIEAARRHGDKTYIVEGDRRLSFDDMFAWRDRLVPLLGIARGDRVAICMRNRSEWMAAFLAIVKAGGVAVLLNSRGAPEELAAMVDEVSPVLVLADGERAERLANGGYDGRLLDLTTPIDELPEPPSATEAEGSTDPNDPCAILFTSGTTGRSKGAVLSHRNLVTALMSVQLSGVMILHRIADRYGQPIDKLMASMPQQAVLLVFPLFHISGLVSGFLSPFCAGTKVVIMRNWDVQEALRLIEQERITMFTGVPTMLWDVLHSAKLAEADLSTLTNIGCGGQALPVNLVEAIHAACPQAAIGTGYGMTECSGAVAQAVGEDFLRKPAAAGRVLPLVDLAIVDSDGKHLPPGEAGEIAARGSLVMKGYHNRPAETAAVLSEDGWLRTGDIGYVDEEGYVFIVDRKKDMVISGGENIYCAEVERVMGEMEGVVECAAFGVPDDRLGERLVAMVVAKGLSEEDIVATVGDRLARYKAPTEVHISEDMLPRNVLGKIDKVRLREHWNDQIAR